MNNIKSEFNDSGKNNITKLQEVYNKLSLLGKNSSLLKEEIAEMYWFKASICFKIYAKNQSLKQPYLEEQIRCLREVIKIVKDKKQVYMMLIDCLIEKDSCEALNLCNKIIFDENFQQCEGLNTEIIAIICKK